MRTIFVSDLHASIRLPMARVDQGMVSSDRLRDVMGILDHVGDHAEEIKASAVFIAGDLFDQQHPDGATLVHTARALAALAARVPTFLLPGNHDAIDRDGRMYSLQMYAELDVPGLTVLGHQDVELAEGARVFAVPWLPDARALKRIRALRAGVGSGDTNLLLFHQGINGALWDSGRASDEGLDPDETVGGWDHAVTGHYHRPQEFGGVGRYLGAPLDLRFGDEEVERRGFWVLDWNSGAWELVPSRAPRFHTHRVKLGPGESFLDHSPPLFRPDVKYLRVIVEGPADVIDRERKVLQEMAESRMGGTLRTIRLDLRPERKDAARLEVDPSLSLAEMARRYAAQFAPEDLPAEELIPIGLRFLEGER